MAEAHETEISNLLCSVRSCQCTPSVYCYDCRQLFCSTHIETHDIVHDKHQKIDVQTYLDENYEEDRCQYCSRHEGRTIILACKDCLKPLCDECMENLPSLEECSVSRDCHEARSMGRITEKIKHDLEELMSEAFGHEMKITDRLADIRKKVDKQLDGDRQTLDKIKTKVEEMKQSIEEFGKNLEKKHVKEMTKKKDNLKMIEASVEDFQTNSKNLRERINKTINRPRHDSTIITIRETYETELNDVKTYDLPNCSLEEKTLKQIGPLKIPLELTAVSREPTPAHARFLVRDRLLTQPYCQEDKPYENWPVTQPIPKPKYKPQKKSNPKNKDT